MPGGNLQADLIFEFCISVSIILKIVPQKGNMSTSNQFAVESNLQPNIMNIATVQLLRNLFLHSLFQTDKRFFLVNYT